MSFLLIVIGLFSLIPALACTVVGIVLLYLEGYESAAWILLILILIGIVLILSSNFGA